jgi:hypothetical protein
MERKRTASSAKSSREHGTARSRRGSSAAVVGFLAMSEHALTVLDFHRVLEQVADRATSGPGQAAVLYLAAAFGSRVGGAGVTVATLEGR